jgi:hypothetical protein
LLQHADSALDAAAREFRIPDQVVAFKHTFSEFVSGVADIRAKTVVLADQRGVRLEDISQELGQAFSSVLDDLKAAFPPPDQAPSHQQRQEAVALVLNKAEQVILDLARKHGMSEEYLRGLQESFEKLKPVIMALVVIAGVYYYLNHV